MLNSLPDLPRPSLRYLLLWSHSSLTCSTPTNKHPSVLFLAYFRHTSVREPFHLPFPCVRTLTSQYLPGVLLPFLQISARHCLPSESFPGHSTQSSKSLPSILYAPSPAIFFSTLFIPLWRAMWFAVYFPRKLPRAGILSCSLLYLLGLQQCLAVLVYCRSLINTCWMNNSGLER